ncbi:type II secretion system minor pseudopilin GspH [Endozoicomonas montiporae]|uniref:Type II secretion system protein H n=1 Tax=Endozoicomonas montiporae CL-33 TaxID=570277 RepID=A0A142BHQ5_9GAMM|nr:type II secretion system minor pseudopilin GspH [Endozoicomonas montiporae]AMO58281.1 general secretion pathway protein H [Endozoicomonas montiporae CL-33]
MRHHHKGFTLLEIMLVLLLLGLATSVVVPNITFSNGSAELQRAAERFAALVETAHEEAILSGRDLGVVINDNDYEFVQFGEEGWESITQDRLLRPATLEENFRMRFTPGETVWHTSLQQQQQDTLLEDWFTKPEDMKEPHLYIWSSGDMTPAEIVFSIQPSGSGNRLSNRLPSFTLQIEETGDVSLVEDSQS